MTVEAALTKLSYLLGRPDLNVDEIRKVCSTMRYIYNMLQLECCGYSELQHSCSETHCT